MAYSSIARVIFSLSKSGEAPPLTDNVKSLRSGYWFLTPIAARPFADDYDTFLEGRASVISQKL
jgi:hypothetical protein